MSFPGRPVRCVETGEVFGSMAEACAAFGKDSRWATYLKRAMEFGNAAFDLHWEDVEETNKPAGDDTPGGRLRHKRLELGITRKELAGIFGHSYGWVERIENGRVDAPPEVLAWMEDPTMPDPMLKSLGLSQGQEALAIGNSLSKKMVRPVPVTILKSVDGIHCIKAIDPNGVLYYLAPEEVAKPDLMNFSLNPLPQVEIASGRNNQRSVRCVETGEVWPSTAAAARDLGVTHYCVTDTIESGRAKNGLHYEWAGQEERSDT